MEQTAMSTIANEVQDDDTLQLVYYYADFLREKFGVREPFASVVAQGLVDDMKARLGGKALYVPAPDKKTRNDNIRKRYDGSNMTTVCEEFGVSESTVYRACKKTR
jgi:Mor family transcriptional regulator